NEALYGISTRPSLLANLNGFWQLSDATDLDVSASWTGGRYEDENVLLSRNLYAAEMSFTWSPPSRNKYRGLNVRAGVMVLDGLFDADGAPLDGTAKGIWTMAETKLNQSWLLGGRFDWTENPQDVAQTAWLVSPTLTWWQSEYVRIRGEYDLLGRSDFKDGRFLLQATFSMGPHKHETY
ncbi:MAG TPA: hypothetical protein VJ997_11055, partial [Longimicrobiales bacterium]|nr:hypothetical protein [Longimicrobiales bacterium]